MDGMNIINYRNVRKDTVISELEILQEPIHLAIIVIRLTISIPSPALQLLLCTKLSFISNAAGFLDHSPPSITTGQVGQI